MLLRHRVPTIFNIYMLDVICCALGCVILLWQVAHQEAEKQTAAARDSQAEADLQAAAFIKAQKELTSASSDVSHLQAAVADWKLKHQLLSQALTTTEKEREDVRKLAAARLDSFNKTRSELSLSETQLAKLRADLEKLFASEKKTKAELTGVVKLNTDLLARLALSDKQIKSLKGDITLKEADIEAAIKKSKEQAAELKLSESEARKLKQLLAALRDENKGALAKMKLTELQLKMREQDLEKSRKELTGGARELVDAKDLIAALTRERDQSKAAVGKLNQRVSDLQAEADQRFAGIPLTGQNVVFLIDISGSMAMKDEQTEDPDKWPFLCETLMKLMKSIPTLQRFQVILFSDKTSYLFGSRDSWFKYEGPKTAEMTRDALKKVKVEGGTNMQDAFEEAFRYRKLKLDTIYLFSDGLPNIGDGVPASVAKPSEAQRNHYMSKFVRDKFKTDWNAPSEGRNNVRINAVGFFFESPDVGAFLSALAREHRGAFVGLR